MIISSEFYIFCSNKSADTPIPLTTWRFWYNSNEFIDVALMTKKLLKVITIRECIFCSFSICFFFFGFWFMVGVDCSAKFACRHSFAPHQRWSAGNMLRQDTPNLMFMHVSLILRNEVISRSACPQSYTSRMSFLLLSLQLMQNNHSRLVGEALKGLLFITFKLSNN